MSLDFAEELSHTENVGTVGMSEIPSSSLVQILVACVILLLFVSVLVFLLSVITIDSLFMIVMHVKVVFYD